MYKCVTMSYSVNIATLNDTTFASKGLAPIGGYNGMSDYPCEPLVLLLHSVILCTVSFTFIGISVNL